MISNSFLNFKKSILISLTKGDILNWIIFNLSCLLFSMNLGSKNKKIRGVNRKELTKETIKKLGKIKFRLEFIRNKIALNVIAGIKLIIKIVKIIKLLNWDFFSYNPLVINKEERPIKREMKSEEMAMRKLYINAVNEPSENKRSKLKLINPFRITRHGVKK